MNLNAYIDIAKKATASPTLLLESVPYEDSSCQASIGLSICERLKEHKPEEVKPVQLIPVWSVPSN